MTATMHAPSPALTPAQDAMDKLIAYLPYAAENREKLARWSEYFVDLYAANAVTLHGMEHSIAETLQTADKSFGTAAFSKELVQHGLIASLAAQLNHPQKRSNFSADFHMMQLERKYPSLSNHDAEYEALKDRIAKAASPAAQLSAHMEKLEGILNASEETDFEARLQHWLRKQIVLAEHPDAVTSATHTHQDLLAYAKAATNDPAMKNALQAVSQWMQNRFDYVHDHPGTLPPYSLRKELQELQKEAAPSGLMMGAKTQVQGNTPPEQNHSQQR